MIAVLLLMPGREGTEPLSTNQTSDADAGIVTPKRQDVTEPAVSGSDDTAVISDDSNTSDASNAGDVTDASDISDVSDDIRLKPAPASDNRTPNAAGQSAPLARDDEREPGMPADAGREQPVAPGREDMNLEQHLSDESGFGHTQIEVPAPADRIEKTLSAGEIVEEAQDQPADSASADQTADALEATKARSAFDDTRGRFGISVVTAPDFSMTPKGGTMGAGDATGVFLHYQVLPRWGLTAGVLYDTKNYWGTGDEYRPPKGYWKALTNGVVPDRIEGTCAMYEVPVSVTFDIVSTRRARLFASAGLASYFVRSEEYYYHFDTPNPGAVNGWTGKRPSTLWFGIGTLSAGFDFRATRSLSVGIEPYFKVPLEGMGWADVDLYSTGVMFTARYHFTKKANKHPPTIQGP
jgi:hypothetical protein